MDAKVPSSQELNELYAQATGDTVTLPKGYVAGIVELLQILESINWPAQGEAETK